MNTRARTAGAVAEPAAQPLAPARPAAGRVVAEVGGRDWRRMLARAFLYAILLLGGLGMIFPFF